MPGAGDVVWDSIWDEEIHEKDRLAQRIARHEEAEALKAKTGLDEETRKLLTRCYDALNVSSPRWTSRAELRFDIRKALDG